MYCPHCELKMTKWKPPRPFKPAVPIEIYKIHPEELEMRQRLIKKLDRIFYARDLAERRKANALA